MPSLPADKARLYLPHLAGACIEHEITTPLRLACFLAEIAEESDQLRAWIERWGPTPDQLRYERPAGAALVAPPGKPALWQRLGNLRAGDGFLFRGRCPIQLTGGANYKLYGTELGVPLYEQPDLAASPEVGFRIAARYWQREGLNELADGSNIVEISKRINGRYNGLAIRLAFFDVSCRAFDLVPPR